MPAFQAINLEPEENVDEQIDTTKELQVDEALKRFQTALKLHAQGPRARDAASAAYKALFDSDIFEYREAISDYERSERQADGRPEFSALESFSAGLNIDAGGADGVAASLSQALYLSFKNYGQFYLDKLKDTHKVDPEWDKKQRIRYHGDDHGDKVLDNWTAALDQDPSDPELWRLAARFAAAMNSGRIRRYCLEAAVELDDDPAVMEVEPPSLAEGLAGEQLKEYLQVLDDDMALSHPVMAPWLRKKMPDFIKRHLDPVPFLPDPTATLTPPPSSPSSREDPSDDFADAEGASATEAISSWSTLGLELIKCMQDTSSALQACRRVLKASQNDTIMEGEGGDEGAKTSDAEDTATSQGIQVDTDPKSKLESKERQPSNATDDASKASEPVQKERENTISTRKRSQSVAGLPDAADEDNAVEKRSKRVRRRTDAKEAEETTDPSTLLANQIQPYQEADLNLFQITKNILETLGVEERDTLDCLQELLDSCATEDRASKLTRQGAKDLRSIILGFNEETAMILLNKKEQTTLGLSSFLEHAKSSSQDMPSVSPFDESQGLRDFAEKIGKGEAWMTSDDVSFEWVRTVSESYATFKWSDTMKLAVVQMLNRVDSVLYERVSNDFELFSSSPEKLVHLESMIPMLFELHIDIYERITNPSSAVDYATRMETKYRLGRWLNIASTYIYLLGRPDHDPLCVRFLWASVMASSLADSPVREHILLLWTSLRDFLSKEHVDVINLPNNIVLPTISPAAADREISKLTTMDFFLGLFQEEMEDPVHVIETLEPVLNPSSVYLSSEQAEDSIGSEALPSEGTPLNQPISECATQGMRDLWKFLLSSSTELRLFLWSRLGDAYAAIEYPTKRFSCLLKSIEMIVADLDRETYLKTPDESRSLLFMRIVKALDELLVQALSLALNESSAFEIIDEDHLRSSSSALAKVSCLLHIAALCEDEARIGITFAPLSNTTFMSLVNKLREMQVRTWSLQYTLFKAGLPQQEGAISPENDLADFLAAVHRAIGLRKFCKLSNKIFLKLMRMELLRWKNVENWEDHLGQVLYDLHGLKLGVGLWEVQDHGCPYEKLEKRQAMLFVEKVMILANRMPMKDLLKSDLKTTIEHMQQTIGQPKSTPQMIHNLRNFTEILKKPIHPLRLYQALTGNLSVDAVTANMPEAALARHGWFFLLGMIALTKFKGVDLNRRQTPGATDDLRIGATFLRLQLQFTADNWEAWFRLAECFDYELDESVLWTADKMNKDRAELVKFQRNAIHCYTLALSNSRHVTVEVNDGDPLHDLYHKFAMRLYSSSREPFAMEPFEHSDQERFFIENMGAGTFKRILHDQMTEYKVWKFAAKLFRMAMERCPNNWKNPYMLAKCYWKMHQIPVEKLDTTDQKAVVTSQLVLGALKKSIEVATNARKSRHSDPILEPHYKIASILHKMVIRGDMPAADAASVLSEQPFGVALHPDDHCASFSKPEDWEEYIIRNLTKLREKDKSNWHHRIVMRHAKILFEDVYTTQGGDKFVEAKAAFAILKENMFTKTMVMNVWKCDAERPGRHHVFTEQYVRFMTRLLLILKDRTNLELLLRRLRKKGADFYHFPDLWQTCCVAYLKLLRQAFDVPQANEEVFKALPNEEFEIISERITEWAGGDGPHVPALGCMKETIELKKLNANLMKAAPIDDLINDCYATIYVDVSKTLPGLEPSKVIAERNLAKEVAAQLEAVAQADAKPPSSLSSILNPPNGQDTGSATPLEADKAEPSARARRAVRRPDVLRKAEQAVLRAMEVPKSATTKSRVGSVCSKRGSQTPAAAASDASSDENDDEEGPDAQVRREAGEDLDEEMKDADANEEGGDDEEHDESRVEDREGHDTDVGSIHDSADDESDLTDLPDDYDDEVPPGLLFPNLGRDETSGEEGESEGRDGDEMEEGGDDEAEDDDDNGDDGDENEREEDEAEDEEGDEEEDNEDKEMAEVDAARSSDREEPEL